MNFTSFCCFFLLFKAFPFFMLFCGHPKALVNKKVGGFFATRVKQNYKKLIYMYKVSCVIFSKTI